MRDRICVLISFILLASVTWGQQPATGSPSATQQSMPGMDMSNHGMSNHDMSNMKGMPMGEEKDSDKDNDASVHVMHSMEGHMDMGPHMKMTALRAQKPGDAARAEAVVDPLARRQKNISTTMSPLTRDSRFFIPRFRRRCTTSPIMDLRWKRSCVSIPIIRRRCCMKSTVTITN